jgi:hypothetical protein
MLRLIGGESRCARVSTILSDMNSTGNAVLRFFTGLLWRRRFHRLWLGEPKPKRHSENYRMLVAVSHVGTPWERNIGSIWSAAWSSIAQAHVIFAIERCNDYLAVCLALSQDAR